jgi:GT2 family glycosyltransferase/glycosyltransferase involved in cell wall biosynthesis
LRRASEKRVGERERELTALRGDLEKRVGERERELTALRGDLELVGEHVRRAAGSRSWVLGHRIARIFKRMTLRRTMRAGALDWALEAIERAESRTDRTEDSGSGQAEEGSSASRPPVDPPGGKRTVSKAATVPRSRARSVTYPVVERNAREHFLRRYLAAVNGAPPPLPEEEMSLPIPVDREGVLIPAERAAAGSPEKTVSVVVCVHDALEDVKPCLCSLLGKTSRPFHLVLVDDGSGPETSAHLKRFRELNPRTTLIENPGEHGYTIAANLGMGSSQSDYVVLLNSDTIVTPGWLERIVECGESDERIGMVSPLSNAATHQSVPNVRENGEWAINGLPEWLTPDGMAFLLDCVSDHSRPRLPFLNGFCLAIKRELIDAVGYFDEENFAGGYCEENDFALRAARAGFELAVVDDAYVYHSKSRSYGPGGRASAARQSYGRFLDKHGEKVIQQEVERLEGDRSLASVRVKIGESTRSATTLRRAFPSICRSRLRVGFVLPGMSKGSSGGVHSVYQEAGGMRALGIDAWVAIPERAMRHAEAAYEDAKDVFVPFAGEAELHSLAGELDVIVATHFKSVGLLAGLPSDRKALAAYYVMDYEPFFFEDGTAEAEEAAASYSAIPDLLHFAKTDWLCNLVGHIHGLRVAKVEPSLDGALFNTVGRDESSRPLRVTAMVRPRTPRRQPLATLSVLDRLRREGPDQLELRTFGCEIDEVNALWGGLDGIDHRGVLTREEVARLLRDSDVFLDASVYQAFGRTGLEAMACGCASVLPRVGGVREFARDRESALLVDTADEEAIYRALALLVSDESLRRRLRKGGTAAAGRYSMTRAALSEYALFHVEYRRRFGEMPAP